MLAARSSLGLAAGSGQIADLRAEHSDHEGWPTRLDAAFGSRGRHFAVSQLNWLIRCPRTRMARSMAYASTVWWR